MWSGKRFVRIRRVAPLLGLAALIGPACSGRSVGTEPDPNVAGAGVGAGGSSGMGGRAGKAGGGSAGLGGGNGGKGGTGVAGEPPFVDPGCPDIPPPEPVLECDVFDTGSPRGEGFACKPQLEHPFGSGCDQQVLHMRCVLPGTGQQGDSCENGMSECADGFICVVGASHGAKCLRMCAPAAAAECPTGYVCGPTDAIGIGVCA
jgi:hypothetical protein